MKRGKELRGNTLVVVLVIIGVLVVTSILAVKFILPTLISKVVNTAIDTSLESLNFDGAKSAPISQDLSQNEGMFLQIGINKGKISIDGKSQGDVINGEVQYLGAQPTIDYQTDKDKMAFYTIKSSDQAGENVILHLSQKTNARVDIGLAAGLIEINLTDLDIPILNVGTAAGAINVTLSSKKSTTANFGAAAGKINVSLPKRLEYRIKFAQAVGSSSFNAGEDLVKIENGYQTKGFDKAEIKADLNVGQAAGGFTLQTIE